MDEKEKRDDLYPTEDEPLLSDYAKRAIMVFLIVCGLFGAWILYGIHQNLNNTIDKRPRSVEDIRQDVGKEVYNEQKRKQEAYIERKEEEKKKEAQDEFRGKQAQLEIVKLEQEQPLQEGYTWSWDAVNQKMVQVPMNQIDYSGERARDYMEPDPNEKSEWEELKEEYRTQKVKIMPPRQDVIEELVKAPHLINWDKIYVTKGQFVFWVQDNLLFQVGNGNEVQTFWDPDTFTLTINVHYGDSTHVESLTREKIEQLYEHSGYAVNDSGKLVINYVDMTMEKPKELLPGERVVHDHHPYD